MSQPLDKIKEASAKVTQNGKRNIDVNFFWQLLLKRGKKTNA